MQILQQARNRKNNIIIKMLMEWLVLSEIKKISGTDSYQLSLLHARVIREKQFAKKMYIDFYTQFKRFIPGNLSNKLIVELGSGGGFIKEVIPNAITSDVMNLPGLDKHFSVLDMPFENDSVDAFFMLNVLHHVNDTRPFLKELVRCLKNKGKVVMIEPANTLWSSFCYRYFHHEQFDCAGGWNYEEGDPLFWANEAIPWIVFYRDRKIFEEEFPSFNIVRLEPHTPFRYIISGGVSMWQLLPSSMYGIVKGIEMILSPFNKYLGMFLTIELEKKS